MANVIAQEIAGVVRMASSVRGNPRYRVSFTDGTSATTKVDSSVGYEISHPTFRRRPLWITYERGQIIAVEVRA